MSVAAECGGKEDGGCNNKKKALSLKIIAIFSIIGASMTGICLPLALSPERSLFSVVKAFAGGIILATGFMHVLPDSFEMLSSSCLKESPWQEFSLSGFAAMISAVIKLMIDSMATSFYSNKHRAILPANGGERETPVLEAGHSHFHG